MILNHKNIATARAIQRAVTYRNKGTVIALYYANVPAKEKVTAYLQETLKDFSFSTVNIAFGSTQSLIERLKAEAQNSQGEKIKHIVFVDGFDNLQDMTIIRDLNMFREAFFKEFNRLIILFLIPKDKESKFRFNAADFWDWISYSFYIEKERTEETKAQPQEVDNTVTQHSSSEIYDRQQQQSHDSGQTQEQEEPVQPVVEENNLEEEKQPETEAASQQTVANEPEENTITTEEPHVPASETIQEDIQEQTGTHNLTEKEQAQALLNKMNANNEKPPQSLVETLIRTSSSAVELDRFMALAKKLNYTVSPELIRQFFNNIGDKEQAMLSLNFLQSKGYDIPSDIIRSLTGKEEEKTKPPILPLL